MRITRDQMIQWLKDNWDRDDELLLAHMDTRAAGGQEYYEPSFAISTEYVKQCQEEIG